MGDSEEGTRTEWGGSKTATIASAVLLLLPPCPGTEMAEGRNKKGVWVWLEHLLSSYRSRRLSASAGLPETPLGTQEGQVHQCGIWPNINSG